MKATLQVVSAILALAYFTGCETESSDQIAIAISPDHVTLSRGESQEFTASGWRDYTWSLSDTSIGVLSTTKGDSTIYTAVRGPVSNDTTLSQVLILTVNVADDGITNTNTTPGGAGNVSAQALITHRYTPE